MVLASTSNNLPYVSVIVPVYNDPDRIRHCLESLTEQTYPNEKFEIIVVDNDSTDQTPEVIREFPVNLQFERDTQSSYAARNTGIEHASGSILAFIDADIVVDSTWLEEAITAIENRDARYLGTNVRVYSQSEEPSLIERYQMAKGFPVQSYITRDRFAPTCCLFVERGVFDEVGLFDEQVISGGDFEFGNRVHDHGIDLHYEPDVVAYHPARCSFSELWKKQRRVGVGKAQLRDEHPRLIGSVLHPRHFLPTSPIHFLGQLDPKYEAKRWEIVIFYLLNYLLKLRRAIAMVASRYRSW